MTQHDLFEHVQTAHARHFEIKSDDLRLQFFDLLQSKVAVHCSANDLNGAVGRKNLWDELAHERGIIDHQHSYRSCHSCPPAALRTIPTRSDWVRSKPAPGLPTASGRDLAKRSR